MIFFDEPSHTYRLDHPTEGELCISATTFIDLFKNKFDADFWSVYTGLRLALNMEKDEFSPFLRRFGYSRKKEKLKSSEDQQKTIRTIARQSGIQTDELNMYQQIALQEWKIKNEGSKQKGTKFHNYKEGEVYKNDGLKYDGVYTKIVSQVDDLSNLSNPNSVVIAPELRMYIRKYRVSGTADKVFIFPDKTFDIDDWKTNIEIKMNNPWDTMKYPLQHLDDCNYNHYCLQVSLYAYILEQWGYKVNRLKFTHVELAEDGITIVKATEYITHYMKKEVEDMLNYFDQNRDELLKKAKK